ncbi:response regulator [Sphingomonas sp. PB2P19]|uniref:response regulator n=1 Tax=Sphingomonas rhamnosi TaxID=3096156 RepID=UPI002FC81296
MIRNPNSLAVLVVEDEPLLRMLAVDMIEDAGFIALEAEDADEAVRILESRGDIRIVFTDVDMPGSMNGALLAVCIRRRWPPIHLIITSGHHLQGDLAMPCDSIFFQKPYIGTKVVATMTQMLH